MRPLCYALPLVLLGCKLDVDPLPSGPNGPAILSQGVVTGIVRDAGGLALDSVIVCATATYEAAGIPAAQAAWDTTDALGRYLIQINRGVLVDVTGSLGVAATPPAGSGLDGGLISGLTIVITSTLPPVDTSVVDLQLPAGQPPAAPFCVG
jgi:hypothetical protein